MDNQDDQKDLKNILDSMDASTRARVEEKLKQLSELRAGIINHVASSLGANLSNDDERAKIEEEVEEMMESFDEADCEKIDGVEITGHLTYLLREHLELWEDIMATLDEHNPYCQNSQDSSD